MVAASAIMSFFDIDEAAEFLRIKPGTLYAWVHQRRIPFRKHGRRVVFFKPDLEGWSHDQAVAPVESPTFLKRGFGARLFGRNRSLKTSGTAEEPQDSLSRKGE
ncbi:MAG: hypothetical protein A2428_00335 [Bdellovibrionales bacterium RIFOXYC1_FULL_54_43]|nr:MAG: hypothetical protein A2428_00335 [Bdellovibrionales bacterium RIFOXYC1_FULL_54_43]OFZ81903.1 MAG: hypothetical protein A2603_03025 [Bdellovibrionales bacterium RIFOXYD1_FULL_55_31]